MGRRTIEAEESTSTAVRLAMAITRIRARMRKESTPGGGWTISQLSMLSRVIERGPVTASELATSEHIRPQSVAEIVAALKAGGLVTSAPDPADGRKQLLTSTAAGRALRDSVLASREAWLDRAIESVVEPSERATLDAAIELLDRLAESRPDVPTGGAWKP